MTTDQNPTTTPAEQDSPPPGLWTAELIPVNWMTIELSKTDGTVPCAVAPHDNPQADPYPLFESCTIPDGRRAIPFLFLWEAEDVRDRFNSWDRS